jgi:hypothetical protein
MSPPHSFIETAIVSCRLFPPAVRGARSRFTENGVGLAETRLLDRAGIVGRALQSLIIEEHEGQ